MRGVKGPTIDSDFQDLSPPLSQRTFLVGLFLVVLHQNDFVSFILLTTKYPCGYAASANFCGNKHNSLCLFGYNVAASYPVGARSALVAGILPAYVRTSGHGYIAMTWTIQNEFCLPRRQAAAGTHSTYHARAK